MTLLCETGKSLPFNFRKKCLLHFSIFRRYPGSLWNKFLACWIDKSVYYGQLPQTFIDSPPPPPPPFPGSVQRRDITMKRPCHHDHEKDASDLVALKISLLGDYQIGKTSFLTKYVGREKGQCPQKKGLNQMEKTLCVQGARIAYNLWEVGGDETSCDHITVACKDSVALLFMFDLTSRCTLNSVIKWHQQARKWNQTAIPVLIGTKFDEFVQLPIDLQWAIASQARAYARAMNAPLFFSSATYNINVNKIFKFITAKLFNLPWDLERNLTIGEPIIDY